MNYNFLMGVQKLRQSRVFLGAIFFGAFPSLAATVTPIPKQVKDGGILRLVIEGERPTHVIFAEKKYPVYEFNSKFEALIGIPFGHKKGPAEAQVVGPSGASQAIVFEVIDALYPSEKLKVDPKHVHLKKKDLARVKRESAEVGALYKNIDSEKLWSGNFALPIESPFTSVFGSKRIYNGQLQSFHQGVDLKAAVGTPIHAPERGRVVFTKDMFLTGHTVIIEHGMGLFTVYGHMSAAKVKVGQLLERGGLVGLAGATGRASGPHLHWGAVINRVKVNPVDLTNGLLGGS